MRTDITTPALGTPKGYTVNVSDARGYAFYEVHLIKGNAVEIYNTSAASQVPPEQFDALDPKVLAKKHNVDRVFLNRQRFWVMDEFWQNECGETLDFDGVRATWMARMQIPPGMKFGEEKFPAYQPSQTRRNGTFRFAQGKQIFMLTSPGGHKWIMQAFTKVADPSLTEEQLPMLGTKLKLPDGWKFEAKTLDQDLFITTREAEGYAAHAVADDLGNMYVGCDFGAVASYVP